MRWLPLLALALLAVGVPLLVRGFSTEGGRFLLVFIVPVIVLEGPVSTLGALLVVLAVILGFLALAGFPVVRVGDVPGEGRPPFPGANVTPRPAKKRFGGFVLLGPVPLVFGSDAKSTVAMLILAIAVTVALLLLFL